MNYNFDIKNMTDVQNAFSQYFDMYQNFSYYSKVEDFTKEEYANLIFDAKRLKDRLTPEKLQQLKETAEAKAVYRFLWGWDLALYHGRLDRRPDLRAKYIISGMLRKKLDPWAKNDSAMADFVSRYEVKNACWGNFTDEEARRDVSYYDDD